MSYLVDANVLSEMTRPSPNNKVLNWLTEHLSQVAVDPIILGELQTGILLLSAGRKRQRLEVWFENVAKTVECLPWDSAVSRQWSSLVVRMRQKGYSPPVLDSMIAATALEHDLTIVTRNTDDFRGMGVRLLNPFA